LKKTVFILASIFLFASCTKSKKTFKLNTKISDSISYCFSKLENDKISDEEKFKFNDKALNLISVSQNTLKNREFTYNIITNYYLLESWYNYKKATKILYKNSLLANDSISLAKSYRSYGNYYYQKQILDSSFYFYTSSEKIYKKINDIDGYSTILLKKGIIQYNINDFIAADLSLSKAYSITKDSDDNLKKYAILNQLGLVSNQLKEYDKAIRYITQALKIVRDNNLQNYEHQEEKCLSNLGLVYSNLKDYQKAIYYYNLSLKNKKLKKDAPIVYSNILDNLAYSKLQIKDYNELPYLFLESLKIRKEQKNTSAIVTSYLHLSEYYNTIGENKIALEYANISLRIAKSSKNPVDILFSLKQASTVDNLNSSKYSDDYLRITDSLQVAERDSQDRFARIQLGTQEIIEEKDVLEDRNRNLLYVFVTTVILASLLFVVRAQRARTRELLFKQNQQKANEEIFNLMMSQQSIIDESRNKEKKRLAQDLHDGVLGRMFGLRLNLDSLNSSTDPDAPQKRQELLYELKTIEQDIREISHDLNREKLVLINNFVSIVHNLLEEQKTSHEASVEYQIDTKIDWDKIGNAIKINLYRILQEGLQNINKYANAKNIKVDISADTENVYLKIKDDGIGFDVNKKSKGIGMQNMISRTHDCQGIIDISSKKDHGTKIMITVPIETKKLIEEES
jgi:signal transduction histidine kinase